MSMQRPGTDNGLAGGQNDRNGSIIQRSAYAAANSWRGLGLRSLWTLIDGAGLRRVRRRNALKILDNAGVLLGRRH
jgi:hypothetical protein